MKIKESSGLNFPDSLLNADLIREINILREIQKIPAPTSNKGKKHRGISWKIIELFDRKQNKLAPLMKVNVTISVAKKRCCQYFAEFEK